MKVVREQEKERGGRDWNQGYEVRGEKRERGGGGTHLVTCVLILYCSILIDWHTSIQPRYYIQRSQKIKRINTSYHTGKNFFGERAQANAKIIPCYSTQRKTQFI